MRINPSVDNDYGIYRAIVAGNRDPLQLGRVKVRIPSFHGYESNGISDQDLPWASLCMVGASSQSGMFIVPEVNSVVWVVFENGNHSSPVVLGGVYSRGTESVRNVGKSNSAYTNSGEGSGRYGGMYETPPGRIVPAYQHDVPDDARVDTSTRILFQSPKGSRIVFRDQDGGEAIEIMDANRQGLKFISPMDIAKSKNNEHKYRKSSENLLGRARMLLSNNLGQFLSFFSNGKKADIDLGDSVTKVGLEIDGDQGILRLVHQTGSKVELKLEDGSISMKSEKGTVAIDKDTITIKASKIKLEGESVEVNGSNLSLAGDIRINGPIKSNSTLEANVIPSSKRDKAPEFKGEDNILEDWTEEV